MNRKRVLLITICIMVLVAVTILVSTKNMGIRPFKNLKVSDIISATVNLTPPDKTIPIVELKELVQDLNEIVIYDKDNSYREASGQTVKFTLIMKDNTKISILENNAVFVIASVGYKTKYEPCEVLSNYANRLLEKAGFGIK